jgi:hypothetical protein
MGRVETEWLRDKHIQDNFGEQQGEYDYDEGRNEYLLQGLRNGAARCVQPRLAPFRRRLRLSKAVLISAIPQLQQTGRKSVGRRARIVLASGHDGGPAPLLPLHRK